jgi:hypothetical protein
MSRPPRWQLESDAITLTLGVNASTALITVRTVRANESAGRARHVARGLHDNRHGTAGAKL